MAINTQDRRASAIGCRRLPWLRRFTLPLADGSITQGDRQQLAFVYRGIEAGEPTVTGTLVGRWSDVIKVQGSQGRIEVHGSRGRIEVS